MTFKFKTGSAELMLKKLSSLDKEFFYSQNEKMTYLNYENESFSYSSSNELSAGLFLFNSVKKCFDKWIDLNQNPVFTGQHTPTFRPPLNRAYKGEKYSYDINHAYWRIAFINGYINEKTYNYGLVLREKDEALKQLYCMTLSVRGQGKVLDGYIGLKSTGNTKIIGGDDRHKDIYADIRYKTYEIMDKIAHKLGDDFIEYNVDCVTFKNKKNCEIVERMLTEENVMFKKVI